MKPLLALALALAQNVAAAQWRIAWTPQSGEMSYRVCRVVGSALTPLGTTSGASLVITANSGDQISVVAFNELGEATPSVHFPFC